MKKLLYIQLLSIFIWSCGGGSDTPPPQNNTPTQPSLVSPTHNLLCIDNVLEFTWNASSDSDGDVISYELQIAKDTQFSQLVHSVKVTSTQKTLSLEKGIAYYWRVKAIDSKNASSDFSSTYQFYTEGEGVSNHLPFSPELVSPTLNSIETESSTILEWTAVDVDTEDSLKFDVYFGTENPPTIILSANQNETTLNVPLSASTTYFWKVTVKDNNGGQTIGQTWNFTTD